MKFRKLFVLSAILTIFSFSCDVTPEEYEGEPNIYAILCVDSSSARIMVGKTTSIDDTLTLVPDTVEETLWYDDTFAAWLEIIFPWNGVSGAEVILKHGEESFSLTEDSTGYYSDSLSCHTGETWTLEVSYSTGEEITSETTIPGNFEITSPLADTLSMNDTLVWTPSESAAGYLVRALEWWSWEDEEEDTLVVDSFLISLMLVQADTTSLPILELFDYLWTDSLILFVSALDTDAYDYRYYGFYWWENLRIEDYMHIEGAWGVFGSQVVERSKTYICLPTDTLPPEE